MSVSCLAADYPLFFHGRRLKAPFHGMRLHLWYTLMVYTDVMEIRGTVVTEQTAMVEKYGKC